MKIFALLLIVLFGVEAESSQSSNNLDTNRYVIGIDCGTESARVGLFQCNSGLLVASGVSEYQSGTMFPKPGWAEQMPNDWWQSVGEACRACISSSIEKLNALPYVVGLSMDTTCCSVVALDEKFVPLRPCLLWMDSRSSPQTQTILDKARGDQSLFVNNDGEGPISAEWMIPKALWIKENEPKIWAKAKYICEKQDFMNHKLTGVMCTSGCNVAARWHWDAELACQQSDDPFAGRPVSLLEKIGLEDVLNKWPSACVEMGRVIGCLTDEAVSHLGLTDILALLKKEKKNGIPVAQGGPDAYVGMVGLGCVTPGKLALITGSSHLHLAVVPPVSTSSKEEDAQIGLPIRRRRGLKGVWGPYSGAPFLGRSFVEGGQSSTGSVLAWTRRELLSSRLSATATTATTNDDDDTSSTATSAAVAAATELSYDSLNAEAANVPLGCEGLLSLATFQGARTPLTDSRLRGALVGLTLSHSRGHVWRAVLEGVCYGTKAAIDALRAATTISTTAVVVEGRAPLRNDNEDGVDEVGSGGNDNGDNARTGTIAVAGGATRSEFWLQMHADVTGSAVTVGVVDNAPLLGSAILAAVGAGYFSEGGESTHLQQVEAAIACMVHPARRLDPSLDRTAQYDRVYAIYSRLAAAVQSICHSLSSSSSSSSLSSSTTSPITSSTATILPSNRPAVIMPSILAADFGSLSQEASDCCCCGSISSPAGCWLHVDVCDGGRAWCPGALTLGPQAVAALHRAAPSLQLEVHVVSDNIDDLLVPLSEAGTSRLTFQLEQVDSSVDWTKWVVGEREVAGKGDDLVVQKVCDLVRRIRSLGMTAGICIAPTTCIQRLDHILSHLTEDSPTNSTIDSSGGDKGVKDLLIDAVDILAVSPGFGGQSFNETVLDKVAFLHGKYPRLKYLEVDGGVNRRTAALAADAGANVLIVGSGVFGSHRIRSVEGSDPAIQNAIVELRNILLSHGK